jgi:hypothetical protein
MTKPREIYEETYTIAKSNFRYANLMKVKTKTEEADCYKITFFNVIEKHDKAIEHRLTYILPK